MVSLASSVHAGPWTFALLVGSGINSGAGVPSGWEMTIDLIRRLAALYGQDTGDDPASCYRERLNGEPDYLNILEGQSPREDAEFANHPSWEWARFIVEWIVTCSVTFSGFMRSE